MPLATVDPACVKIVNPPGMVTFVTVPEVVDVVEYEALSIPEKVDPLASWIGTLIVEVGTATASLVHAAKSQDGSDAGPGLLIRRIGTVVPAYAARLNATSCHAPLLTF